MGQFERVGVPWWRDRDRRRAALLSWVLHLLALWLLLALLNMPEPEPPETFLVIDIGTPLRAETTVQAPTVDAPAPTAEIPRVADEQFGEPQVAQTPSAEVAAAEVAAETVQPEAPAAAVDAPEPQTVETPRPPVPSLAPPPAVIPEVAASPTPVTPLPLANLPDIDPLRSEARLSVPIPAAESLLAEAIAIAATASVSLAPETDIPRPEVGVSIPEPIAITPEATASLVSEAAIPVPEAISVLADAAPVPIPAAEVNLATALPVPVPGVTVGIGAALDVSVEALLEVAQPTPIPNPSVAAEVIDLGPVGTAAPLVGEGPADASENLSRIDRDREAGGDAPVAAQAAEPAEPVEGGLGQAAAPDGARNPTGTPALPAAFAETLQRPLAVIVDNSGIRAISGIRQASVVLEMPVEGAIPRLMLKFDRQDPPLVGPVRSARDYFVTVANAANAALVHLGASPQAYEMIWTTESPPTFDLIQGRWDDLQDRIGTGAPFNAFLTDLVRVRQEVNRFNLIGVRNVTGAIYRPPSEARSVAAVTVGFGGAFSSGFLYDTTRNQYAWLRNGVPGLDADEVPVAVDAVLIGGVSAQVIPGDSEGRLNIPMNGGPATLYANGRAIDGRWELRAGVGVGFVGPDGAVDLTPYRTWVVLSPGYATRAEAN